MNEQVKEGRKQLRLGQSWGSGCHEEWGGQGKAGLRVALWAEGGRCMYKGRGQC